MSPAAVASVRASLHMTQSELSSLLGCHWITISKWERGELIPRAHDCAMLEAFRAAAVRVPGIGKVATHLVASQGVARALWTLLDAAYGPLRK